MSISSQLPDQQRFFIRVIEAEKQNPQYKKNDVHTYSQETIANGLLTDLEIHMFGDLEGFVVGSYDKHGDATRGNYHTLSRDQASESTLKFTKPKSCTHILTKKMLSVLTPFIVNRYQMFTNNTFNRNSILHAQKVKVFYCSHIKKFFVSLPDHFFDEIDEARITGPKSYKRGQFLYDSQQELEKEYPKDIIDFATDYLAFFNQHREGNPVIIFCSNEKGFSHLPYEMRHMGKGKNVAVDFDGQMIAARGMLFGNLFYAINEDGSIKPDVSWNLKPYKDPYEWGGEGLGPAEGREQRDTECCIKYTKESWEKITEIFESFHRAQNALFSIIENSKSKTEGEIVTDKLNIASGNQFLLEANSLT